MFFLLSILEGRLFGGEEIGSGGTGKGKGEEGDLPSVMVVEDLGSRLPRFTEFTRK